VGGGVTFAGITTFHSNVDLGSNSLEGSLQVATGAIISGSTNTITGSTNGSERFRVSNDGTFRVGTDSTNVQIAANTGLDINDGAINLYQATSNNNATPFIISTDVGGTETEKLRFTAQGRLGIGTDVPEGPFHIVSNSNAQAILESSNINADLVQADPSGSTRIRNNSGELKIYTDGDASSHIAANSILAATFNTSGNLAFPNGQGIDFSATAGSGISANGGILDDYEEGTWTPTSETGTINSTSAKYTKIGNIVHLNVYIDTWSNITSDAVVQIQGLPYAGENTDANVGSVMYRYIDDTDGIGGDMVVFMANGTSLRFYFQNSDGDSNYAALKHKDINGNTSSFRIQMTYRVA
jgi:hypothetical protein